jgi:hypothetical protein
MSTILAQVARATQPGSDDRVDVYQQIMVKAMIRLALEVWDPELLRRLTRRTG